MHDDPLPDPGPDPDSEDRVNHLAYLLIAVIVVLIFWYGAG